jgi:hypothetical protein
MVQKADRQRRGFVVLILFLWLCLAALPPAAAVMTGGRIVSQQGLILTVTVGGVACPQSVITGWTLGHGWSLVTNVVACSTGNTAAWLLVGWRDGTRSSLCVDSSHQRC